MEWIRNWCSFLCYGAIGCCAVQLLVPDKGTGKVFRLLAMTFFLCCAVLPMITVRGDISLPTSFLSQELIDEALNERVEEQLKQQVETVVTEMTTEALANRKITPKKVEVYTDTSENGSIYIKQVIIHVDKQNIPIANVVGEMLETQWNTTVVITAGG